MEQKLVFLNRSCARNGKCKKAVQISTLYTYVQSRAVIMCATTIGVVHKHDMAHTCTCIPCMYHIAGDIH